MPAPRIPGLAGQSVVDLGLGPGLGDMLSTQLQSETDEERKKRLLRQQQAQALGPAAQSIFGGVGGIGF